MGLRWVAAIWVVGLVFTGCPLNECDFLSRCEGNVLQFCGDGVDQQIGRRVREVPCEGLNPFCMEENGEATCTSSPTSRCTGDFTECDGNILTSCSRASWNVAGGFPFKSSCAETLNPQCVQLEGSAFCTSDLTTRCSGGKACESDEIIVWCRQGYPERYRCGGGTCRETGPDDAACDGPVKR